MSSKITAPKVRALKASGTPLVCLTAYDAVFGEIADAAGVDVVLVGDSVGNTLLGYPSTLPVSLEQIVHHTKATRAGVKRALLVSDLPFGSYNESVSQAVRSAVELMKAGADAVKLEGVYTAEIEAIVKAGIPVMGHVGMTPQSVHRFGGFRVQGKGEDAQHILNDAISVEEAGVFSMVLELIPALLAKEVTERVTVPTIGIGAGPHCDGQIQVLHDVLGLTTHHYRHAKPFAHGYDLFVEAIKGYSSEVRDKSFPTEENSF
jgi:3-methyl-2-oxobutanoate hydroxymethyltransferase